jgi:hypothetical protein
MSGTSITVTVVGTSIAATVDAAGNFTLEHVPAGDDDLEFESVEIHARVRVAGVTEREEIRLRIIVNGTSVDVESNERHTPDNRVEIEGRVTEVNAVARTLRVGSGTLVTVPAGTPIRHGDTRLDFAQIHVGDRIHVHATNTGTTVSATAVEVQTEHGNPEPGDNHGEMELKGTMSAKAGTCPSVTFTVSSTNVATNASTQFKDTACGALTSGDRVEVKGARQSNGTVLATRVEKKK